MQRNPLYPALVRSLYAVSEGTAEFLGELLYPLSNGLMIRERGGVLTCKYNIEAHEAEEEVGL